MRCIQWLFCVTILSCLCLGSGSATAQRVSYETFYPLKNCDNEQITDSFTVACGGTEGVRISGYNAITVFFSYFSSTGVGWVCTPEVKDNKSNLWYRMSTQQINSGEITISPLTWKNVVAPGEQSFIVYNITENYDYIRLGCTANGVSGPDDRLTVGIRAAYTPAF